MQEDKHSAHDEEPGLLRGKAVSHREFLKIAGIAGATVGMGSGLGGLVAACGATTTTTAATTATTAGPATTAGATTTVSAGPTAGRKIKLGFVTPQTVTCLSNSRI